MHRHETAAERLERREKEVENMYKKKSREFCPSWFLLFFLF
jgi:hypothetical protein